jgi:DNA modification methylase
MNDFSPHGVDLFGEPIKPPNQSPVASKFIMPPFSVLNAREGEWQDRKRAWASLGIKGEESRTESDAGERQLLAKSSGTDFYAQKRAKELELGRDLTTEDFQKNHYDESKSYDQGTSIFDPVVCELAYSWFTAPGHQVLDPFAGGSVRGIVAGMLGRKYQGHELRAEQVAANLAQCAKIAPQAAIAYVTGDSAKTSTRGGGKNPINGGLL